MQFLLLFISFGLLVAVFCFAVVGFRLLSAVGLWGQEMLLLNVVIKCCYRLWGQEMLSLKTEWSISRGMASAENVDNGF